MRYRVWQTEINSYGSFFNLPLAPYPSSPLKTRKILKKIFNFEKMKKRAEDIIILLMCTKNLNHMRYGSWDTEWDRQNFLFFWAIFFPFNLPQTFEKMKKLSGDTNTLNICTNNCDHMMYASWVMKWDTFCHFRPFFALLPYYWPCELKFGKNIKKTWRYYPLPHAYHKWGSYNVWFLRYKVQQT